MEIDGYLTVALNSSNPDSCQNLRILKINTHVMDKTIVTFRVILFFAGHQSQGDNSRRVSCVEEYT